MSTNTVYSTPPLGVPGQDQDTGLHDAQSFTLEDDCAPGLFVTQGVNADGAASIDAANDLLLGLLMKQDHLAASECNADGEYVEGTTVAVKKSGRAKVLVKGAFTPASSVYVRYVADTDEAVGSISASHDAGKNRLVPRQAIRFLNADTDDIALIELNVHDDEIDAANT